MPWCCASILRVRSGASFTSVSTSKIALHININSIIITTFDVKSSMMYIPTRLGVPFVARCAVLLASCFRRCASFRKLSRARPIVAAATVDARPPSPAAAAIPTDATLDRRCERLRAVRRATFVGELESIDPRAVSSRSSRLPFPLSRPLVLGSFELEGSSSKRTDGSIDDDVDAIACAASASALSRRNDVHFVLVASRPVLGGSAPSGELSRCGVGDSSFEAYPSSSADSSDVFAASSAFAPRDQRDGRLVDASLALRSPRERFM